MTIIDIPRERGELLARAYDGSNTESHTPGRYALIPSRLEDRLLEFLNKEDVSVKRKEGRI